MMRKTTLVLQNFLCGVVLVLVGAIILLLPQYPEMGSAIAGWIETQDIALNLGIAIILLSLGLWLLSSSVCLVTTKTITHTKGTLRTSLGKDLLNQTVTQLWHEYFHRSDLTVSVALRKRSLEIFGQVPEGWNKHDELAAFLSNRLLTLTGYWGEISLHSSPIP
jgi:hypothetical protein